jgi:hypothetical protein
MGILCLSIILVQNNFRSDKFLRIGVTFFCVMHARKRISDFKRNYHMLTHFRKTSQYQIS